MKRLLACLGLVVVLTMPASAFRPSGWVYFNWPWAYDTASGDWHWFKPTDRQWVATMSNGQWARMENSALATGWSYHVWPFVYAQGNGAWHWFNQTDRQWVVNMRSGIWSRLGQPQWEPGRSVGPVKLGDTYAGVLAKLGVPDEVRRTGDPGDYTHWNDYDVLGLKLAYDDGNGDGVLNPDEIVDGIFAWSLIGSPPPWTYRGITFGSSRVDAVAVLGPPNIDDHPTAPWWTNHGVMLTFGDGGLNMIYVYVPF